MGARNERRRPLGEVNPALVGERLHETTGAVRERHRRTSPRSAGLRVATDGHAPNEARDLIEQHRDVREAAAAARLPPTHVFVTRGCRRERLSADHLVNGELLDVRSTLRLDSRRCHPFRDPWSEGVEVSA